MPLSGPRFDALMMASSVSYTHLDRRQDAVDAGGVADLAILHGNVEVDADKRALAGEIGVIEGAEGSHRALLSDAFEQAGIIDDEAVLVDRQFGLEAAIGRLIAEQAWSEAGIGLSLIHI